MSAEGGADGLPVVDVGAEVEGGAVVGAGEHVEPEAGAGDVEDLVAAEDGG